MKALYIRINEFNVMRIFKESDRYLLWNMTTSHWMPQEMEDWWDLEDYNVYE